MKTPAQVVKDIERRLQQGWHAHLTGDEAVFPHAFPLGKPPPEQLCSHYPLVHQQIIAWQDWAREHQVALAYTVRLAAGGTRQHIPTHVTVPDIETAAAIVGDGWPERLERGRQRLALLAARYPQVTDHGRVLRRIDDYTDIDVELLMATVDFFRAREEAAAPITARQVPIPGVHAKWLQNHEAVVRMLTGGDDLGLLPKHPSRIHFTYLDPEYRASGRRLHDSATVGDTATPAYRPTVVVISENKDTALWFPPLPGGISVEGVGRGGKTLAAFEWLRDAPVVIYWGDIDADGLEILDGYRADFNRDLDAVLMDPATYAEFERYGTNFDKHDVPLAPRVARPTPRLRSDERVLYEMLVAPQHTGHRRIEQERIPLPRALAEVQALLASRSQAVQQPSCTSPNSATR